MGTSVLIVKNSVKLMRSIYDKENLNHRKEKADMTLTVSLKNLRSHTFQFNWWFTVRSTSCDGNLCTNIRKVGVSEKHRKLVRLLSRNFYLPSFYVHLPTNLTVHVFSITHLPAVVEIGC